MNLPVEITPELIEYIKKNYALHWNGIHGWNHWVRVYENGLHLARQNGADQLVVALFAFTHDMARQNDNFDPFHGPRAADRVHSSLQGKVIHLMPRQFEQLTEAIRYHTRGLTRADLTVMTCWDADRLDLGRVGIYPAPKKLCTAEARVATTIEWAYQRSIA